MAKRKATTSKPPRCEAHPNTGIGINWPPRGASAILTERSRQIHAEGWSYEHDDKHPAETLARAASCYLTATIGQCGTPKPPIRWPWGPEWWKPEVCKGTVVTTIDFMRARQRELEKAGALIAAEWDRYDREINRQTALNAAVPQAQPSVHVILPEALTKRYHTLNSAGETVDITDEVHALIRKNRGVKE